MAFQEQLLQTIHTLAGNFLANLQLLKIYVKTHPAIITPFIIFILMLTLIRMVQMKQRRARKEAKAYKPKSMALPPLKPLTSEDIKLVAGDDLITTQLDLARAYIEMDKINLAKSILYNVSKQGMPEQQKEARELIDTL